MPTIPDFIYHSLPPNGTFYTNPSLGPGSKAKVDENGSLQPFAGDTTVFLLDNPVKARLKSLQNDLYASCGSMLCMPRLQQDSFHMTLHDLYNDGDTRYKKAPYTQEQMRSLVHALRERYPQPVTMHATQMFSLVASSIVLGLVAETDEMERQLNCMYQEVQSLFPVGYGLLPHITLAYYKPGEYAHEIWKPLCSLFQPVKDLKIILRPEQLVLQRFTDMNHYETVNEWA